MTYFSGFAKIFRFLISKIKNKEKRQNTPTLYKYKNFSINLPSDHLLPIYQSKYPTYDKFLPHLVSYLNDDDVVVDVGANVGDTLAAMADVNPKLSYICIEPDRLFHDYLLKNIDRIKKVIPNLNVRVVNALVGRVVSNVSLEGFGGTKHAVAGNGGSIQSVRLDELISKEEAIRLLKSDVDGFDYDVLHSAEKIIEADSPILFFECQFDSEKQKAGYVEIFKFLERGGYSEWIAFDNFGAQVVRTDELDTLFQLLDYVWRQNIAHATRTIYYFDVLAVHGRDVSLVNKVLNSYGTSGC